MSDNSFIVQRLTNGPKHHLFGFHDLYQTNAGGEFALSLEVDDISHPPLPGETCWAGVVSLDGRDFLPIQATHTWNYPQGARQQWVGESALFTVNDRDENGEMIAWICDASAGKSVGRLSFPVHCLCNAGQKGLWFNYDRVHACGGYGYNPVMNRPLCRLDDIPSDDGIWCGDLKTGEKSLLVSIGFVASTGETRPVRTGFPPSLTHLFPHPSGTRIAFLHRYRLIDGGETTRLMSIGIDGSDLRCLAKGFLSHFTWISNEDIFIWGAHQPQLYGMRESPWLKIPGVLQGAMLGKHMLKNIRRSSHPCNNGTKNTKQDKFFLVISDSIQSSIRRVGAGVLTEDGHPMSNPLDRSLIVDDTYPDIDGNRRLMLYNVKSECHRDIGSFQMIMKKPDLGMFDWMAAQAGMDMRVAKNFSRELYMFTRSGLHCDLHPRWSYDGKTVYFDSIHEGTRQIYYVKIS